MSRNHFQLNPNGIDLSSLRSNYEQGDSMDEEEEPLDEQQQLRERVTQTVQKFVQPQNELPQQQAVGFGFESIHTPHTDHTDHTAQ